MHSQSNLLVSVHSSDMLELLTAETGIGWNAHFYHGPSYDVIDLYACMSCSGFQAHHCRSSQYLLGFQPLCVIYCCDCMQVMKVCMVMHTVPTFFMSQRCVLLSCRHFEVWNVPTVAFFDAQHSVNAHSSCFISAAK